MTSVAYENLVQCEQKIEKALERFALNVGETVYRMN
jgi:hypothetical protein